MIFPPFADNPLRTRADLQRATRDLFHPLRPFFSPGKARVKLGPPTAGTSQIATDLEAFTRPLWGLIPLAAGGGEFDGWDLFTAGIDHGTDPAHPEWWRDTTDGNQRSVEMAAFGLGLALTPERLWTPLSPEAQARLTRWLGNINHVELPENNWRFFRVLVNLGLRSVGAKEFDPEAMADALDLLETFALPGAGGWYKDGAVGQRDYYIPMAMHFYGLIYARLAGETDPARAERFRTRARAFAPEFMHWFAADGSAVAFGRSLTYRFAQGAFWGALAFVGEDAGLGWGVVKGLLLRHLRWWSKQSAFSESGLMSIGYTYPNLNMAEDYNAPGSPYWALKSFLPLALREDHPFWRAEEAPLPPLDPVRVQEAAGFVACRDAPGKHVWVLANAEAPFWNPRHAASKYGKFVYSNRFGFLVPTASDQGLSFAAHDGMLALSEEGNFWRVRSTCLEQRIEGNRVISRWRPWPDVEIETTLEPAGEGCHTRTHRVRSGRRLLSAEGGFALGWSLDEEAPVPERDEEISPGLAATRNVNGRSAIRDLDDTPGRLGEIVGMSANSSLSHPRCRLPTLRGEHAPGEYILRCEVTGTV